MADNQITPFQLTDQFTMDNFNQRINETNIALQNKAPNGYGLGPASKYLDSWNNANANGFYYSRTDAPTGYWWFGSCEINGNSTVRYLKIECPENNFGYTLECRRSYVGGAWEPWEWVNPPMELGKEYRTTERYLGKPVYYKLWNYGYLPATATLDVAHGIENIKSIWVDLSKSVITASANFADSSFENLSPMHPLISRIHPRIDSDGRPAISITTSSNAISNYRAALCLKYTKTTD